MLLLSQNYTLKMLSEISALAQLEELAIMDTIINGEETMVEYKPIAATMCSNKMITFWIFALA